MLEYHRFPTSQDPDAPQADQTDDALAAFGLCAERSDDGAPSDNDDAQAPPLHLWSENWPVWCLWRDVETQWQRAGVDGRETGLDYAGVWCVIAQRFRRRQQREVFWLVQAMEEATLQEWRARDAQRA